jgi:N6-adenosine-specific RNA methylase IME4
MTRYRTVVADPPWPIGDFPAWYREDRRSERERELGFNPTPYPTMTLDEIKALPVGAMAAPGAHLYLWTTPGFLWSAREVAERWGFRVSKVLTWCKAPMGAGMGGAFANTTEFILFGRFRVGGTISAARRARGWSQDELQRRLTGKATRLVARWEEDSSFPSPEDWNGLSELLGVSGEITPPPSNSNTTWFQWPRGAHSAKPEAFLDLVEQVSPGPYLEMFARRARFGWDYWGDESLGTAKMVA